MCTYIFLSLSLAVVCGISPPQPARLLTLLPLYVLVRDKWIYLVINIRVLNQIPSKIEQRRRKKKRYE